MVSISGTYQFESQENIEALWEAMGMNAAKRKLMASTTPTIEVTFDGTTFKELIKTKVRNHEFECKLNEEFSHEVPELGEAMNLMTTFENDDEIITKPVDGSAKLTRKFSSNGMVKIFEKNGVIGKRTFKRI